ncbi:hypothetical protein ACVWY2_004384 [Bradyrhizobium sp. JR6.1]
MVLFAERKMFDSALGFPFGEAALEIALEAGGGLVAILGSLGQKLHDDRRDGTRHVLCSFDRWYRSLRDVAVHPSHGIGRGERENGREHPVKRDAERVQVAAGIDGPVHAAGLLGRHIGQRACDRLRWFELLTLTRQARCEAESGDPDLVGFGHQKICGLQVLVDQAPPMELLDSNGDS